MPIRLFHKNRFTRAVTLMRGGLFALAFCSAIHNPPAFARDEENSTRRGGLVYEVDFQGIEKNRLYRLLNDSSRLLTLRDLPPPSQAGLSRRIDEDLSRFQRVLRSEGYYGAVIETRLDQTQSPAKITFNIKLGDWFLIDQHTIEFVDNGAVLSPLNAPPIGQRDATLGSGTRLKSQRIVDAERRLIRRLKNIGYPFAEVSDRKVRVDFATKSARIVTTIDDGGFRTFGPLRIEGAQRVQEGFVQNFVPWKQGTPFDVRKISSFDRKLENLELFQSVRVEYVADNAPENANGDTDLPMTLIVKERKHRSFGLGVNYSTNEGAGGRILWENRNLFGRGERFSVEAGGTQLRQGIDAVYRQPEFGRSDQVLILGSGLQREDSDAFDEVSGTISAAIERRISRRLTLTGTVEAEFADLEDSFGSSQSQLIAFPLLARWDSTDNLLDPKKGVRASGRLVPHLGANEGLLTFVSFDATGSTYQSFGAAKRFTLAGRVRASVATGERTEDIPANRRFYAGGAGSIRGFDFREVGPLDSSGDPIGGRSRLELGLELRTKVTRDIGLVPFIEGGNVYDEAYPDFSGKLRWGAGLGLRYFTAIGPLRFDIATPLNPRKGVDGNIEFYISLGQAF